MGFRWSAKEMADKYQITGFVRNVGEDYLYIEAEGEENQLNQFLAWCRKGPFFARVERVEKGEGERKGFTEFEVLG